MRALMFSLWPPWQVASAERFWVGRYRAGHLLEDSRSRLSRARKHRYDFEQVDFGAWVGEPPSRTLNHGRRRVCVMVWRSGCVRRGREWSGVGRSEPSRVLARGTHTGG